MAKSKKRYLVFSQDVSAYQTGSLISGYYESFDTEDEAEAYAATSTTQGGVATIAVTTKLLKPKPVEMVTVELAEEC